MARDSQHRLPLVTVALPCTLLDLWHRRTHGLLRLAEYEAMSDGVRTGLAMTVARRANRALSELSPGRREIARRILLRLVQFSDGMAMARRQQSRAALATAGDVPEEIDAVVRHLADRRLVTTSGGDDDMPPNARVDLAHEVLLLAWPALGEWIRSPREDEQHRRVLEAKAAEWVKTGRGQSRLLDADELREARGWLSDDRAREVGVSDEIQSLLTCSEAALTAQAAEIELRRRRWRRWVTVALVVLTGAVVAVSTLAVIAEQRSREARQQLAFNYVAQGQSLLMRNQVAQAAPYLFAAREAGVDNVSLRTLFRWAAQNLPLLQITHSDRITSVAWSPDGRRVATASTDKTARAWDAVSGQAVTPSLLHQGWINVVGWSPDGRRVATASEDKTARVWDAVSGQAVTPPLVHDDRVSAVAWSPDGSRLATASADKTVRVWDAISGKEVTPPFVHRFGVGAVTWSPDGARIVTYSEMVRVWEVASGARSAPSRASADRRRGPPGRRSGSGRQHRGAPGVVASARRTGPIAAVAAARGVEAPWLARWLELRRHLRGRSSGPWTITTSSSLTSCA